MILQSIGTRDIKIGELKVKTPVFDSKDLKKLAERMEGIWEGKIRKINNGFIIYFKKNPFNYGLKFWSLYDFFMNFEPTYSIAFVSKEIWEKI